MIGRRLGPYDVVAKLGAGGMGEVYRAVDATLGREVAIKVLPTAFALDAERLARFEREAQVLASLNHPHIAHIHGLEESGRVRGLVLELVPGETLAERISRGPVPLEEALAIARQIADALEAAHEKGIVHRDLKPANVKCTPEGSVKVLDFGLAKAVRPDGSSPDVTSSPTLTAQATQAGVVIGTAAYMSPEQARGKPIDKRTDVWAFGAVLYEMLTGKKAFGGETVSDTLAAVLKTDPDWRALPPETTAAIRRLLRRCLERDPKRRLHDIADARIEMDAGTEETVAGPVPASGSRRWVPAAAALLAAAIAGIGAWILASRREPAAGPLVTRLARLTRDSARAEWPSWSPDGTLLAYSSNRTGDSEIYVRRGEGGQDVDITNDPAEDVQPAFSPNGDTVAFISTRSSRTGLVRIGGSFGRNVRTYGGDLWVVPALGGGSRRLAPNANFPAWRPDGAAILYVTGPENRRAIMEVPAKGGPARPILPSEASNLELSRIGCSPDGRWISLETQEGGLRLMPASGGESRTLVSGAGFGHAWDRTTGRLYFINRDSQGGSRIQFFEGRADPFSQVPHTVSLMTSDFLELAVTGDGLRIATPEQESARNLTRIPLDAGGGAASGPEEPLTSGLVTDSYPSVSPDGRRVAIVSDVLGHMEVRIVDVTSRKSERVPLPGEDVAQVSPAWMPDGQHLLVSRSLEGTQSSNWILALDGSQAEQLVVRSAQGAWILNASPDGKTVYYSDSVDGTQQVFALDLATRKKTQLSSGPGDKFDAICSPDGKWLAVTATKDGVIQLFRMPASGGPLQQLTTGHDRMRHPFFSRDGRWIYIQPSHGNIYRVKAEGGPLEQVTRFPEGGLFLEEPTISPDGRYLYYCRANGGSALWLMTLEDPSRP